MSRNDLKEIFEKVDEDNSGEIDFAEFKTAMTATVSLNFGKDEVN